MGSGLLFCGRVFLDIMQMVAIIEKYVCWKSGKSITLEGADKMPKGKHILSMPKGKHIFGTVRVGDKGQIVIPKEARSVFGIGPGDSLLVLGDEENGIVLARAEVISDVALQILGNINENANRTENGEES